VTVASVSAAADEIEALFTAAWASAGPVDYPNTAFTRPAAGSVWARLIIEHNAGSQRTLGGSNGRPRFGKVGVVAVEIFTPLGRGVKAGYDYAETVLNAYEGKRTSSDVWFRNAHIIDGALAGGDDKGWWVTTFMAEFDYEKSNS
jgi:hypothetical protein